MAGIEEVWEFFGGVTRRLMVDNLRAAVVKSDRYAPLFNRTFLEYSEHRGFIIDPAVAGMPTGKPDVKRQAPYVRQDFFRGESFRDIAGLRIHGTTRKKPRIVFEEEEMNMLLSLEGERFDAPRWAVLTVRPDYHVKKAADIGGHCRKFMEALLTGDFPWARLRQTQKLLRLVERYGRERMEKAMREGRRLRAHRCGAGGTDTFTTGDGGREQV